jgi:hypothetical protein
LGSQLTDSSHEALDPVTTDTASRRKSSATPLWVYHRFCLSFRDVEDLLAERGIIVSYEAIRQWCWKFGPDNARRRKKKRGRLGDTWYLDELRQNQRPAAVSLAGRRSGR